MFRGGHELLTGAVQNRTEFSISPDPHKPSLYDVQTSPSCFTLPSLISLPFLIPLALPHLLAVSHRENASPSIPSVSSVVFEELSLAISRMEKHEVAPTRLAITKGYRETVKIGSASSWDKDILNLFHVKCERNSFADLREIVDARYFEPPDDDEEARSRINS